MFWMFYRTTRQDCMAFVASHMPVLGFHVPLWKVNVIIRMSAFFHTGSRMLPAVVGYR